MTARNKSLILGIGINDAEYKTSKNFIENGKRKIWQCPFYKKWKAMIRRCYSKSFIAQCPTYKDVTVCVEWHRFSNFKNWMLNKNWQGMELDKDILVEGNKIYSPEFCVFVTKETNSFLLDRANCRGSFPIGVKLDNRTGKFRALCRDGKKQVHLGMFENSEDAHLAWKKFKYERAIYLASKQTDPRLALALIDRFKPLTKEQQ